MFYQREFKTLHQVRRSGKRKFWIPLERWTRVESEKHEGESEEGPREMLLLPILRLFLGWIFKSPWIVREVKERRWRKVSTVWGRGGMVNDRGERRKRGVKGFLLLWPHGLTPGVTGQTGDGHRSDRWQLLVKPERPYRFFRPPVGRTEDPDKIQQRVLIGRTDAPTVVPALFLLFEILLLETSPKRL
jgi:hypothetical protein